MSTFFIVRLMSSSSVVAR